MDRIHNHLIVVRAESKLCEPKSKCIYSYFITDWDTFVSYHLTNWDESVLDDLYHYNNYLTNLQGQLPFISIIFVELQYPRKVHEKFVASYWFTVKNGKFKSVYLLKG